MQRRANTTSLSGRSRWMASRYYISSLSCHGRRFAGCMRSHWSIENNLHWVLDMTFREDESRVRERCLADNLGWLRRLALTLLKQHSGKDSIAMKRRLARISHHPY